MNELLTQSIQLPDTIEDLSKFALIGREKLVAVRAEIRAIQKVGLAKEVYEQKLKEAQEIAEAVLDAETKIGELTAAIPKATKGNQYTGKMVSDTAVDNQKSKSESLEEIGISQKQAERFETLAKHPEAVEAAKAEARKNNEIVTRAAVLKRINPQPEPHRDPPTEIPAGEPEPHSDETPSTETLHMPHVSYNSGENEWYTPPEIAEAARNVLEEIDIDPASCAEANSVIKAKRFYSIEDDGLKNPWEGRVYLNPPYTVGIVEKFIDKLEDEIEKGNVTEFIVLVNNATETKWFRKLASMAISIAFPTGRLRFWYPGRESRTPLQGQAILYGGTGLIAFEKEFSSFGWICDISRA